MTPVYKLSASSITGRTTYGSMLAGNPTFVETAFQSIATVTVGSGGAASAEFTSIPSTFAHLQIRGIGRTTYAGSGDGYKVTVNNAGGTSYSYHLLIGNGSAASAAANSSAAYMILGDLPANTEAANIFGAIVFDILDYANVNKYTTIRSLAGDDRNGSGSVRFASGLYQATTAISSVKIESFNAGNLAQYSHFALYGIKGAA